MQTGNRPSNTGGRGKEPSGSAGGGSDGEGGNDGASGGNAAADSGSGGSRSGAKKDSKLSKEAQLSRWAVGKALQCTIQKQMSHGHQK